MGMFCCKTSSARQVQSPLLVLAPLKPLRSPQVNSPLSITAMALGLPNTSSTTDVQMPLRFIPLHLHPFERLDIGGK